MKFVKKNMLFIVAAVLLMASIVFFVYNIKADSEDNKIGISYAEMISIQTGTGDWSNDGLDYSDTSNYHKTTDYTAGNDSGEDNAIVRSFDKIVYNFEFQIKNKDEFGQSSGLTSYTNKTINVVITVPEEVAKYVVFKENGKPGQTSYTYEITDVNEINGSKVTAQIPIYVLGAPNGTIIDPKFEISESTNTDSNYVVTLGKKDNSTHNYSFSDLREDSYRTTADFYNYMPTVVSSVNSLNLSLELKEGTSQKATVNSKVGRYMNYVLTLSANGPIKGHVMPKGDITLNGTYSQTGTDKAVLNEELVRLYNTQTIGEVEAVTVKAPYSSTSVVSRDKYTTNPGTVSVSNITNNSFTLKIVNPSMGYTYPTANADGSGIDSNKYYIGTYAITLFSPRVPDDGGNNINVTLGFGASNVTLTDGTASLNATSLTSSNEVYEVKDYDLVTGLYELDGTKVSEQNGLGAKSKGSEIQYITEFNYLSTSSNEGLKEIIKIDPVAYKFIPYASKDDIIIEAYCGESRCENISQKDFEYKFVAGVFDNRDYTATNYDTVDSKIKSEEANVIKSGCTAIKNGLSTLNSDQIMNLYGGPCISESNPVYYNSIASAVTSNNEEVVLTKLIVQTKDNVKLPDNAKIVIKTKLRIRNMSDISRTYQVTTAATSSDYDSKITYYAPRVVNTSAPDDSILNPNNYNRTIYTSNSYSYDSSLFGDSLKILSFEAKQKITVTNKKNDGKMKTNFNVVDNETIHFKVSTNLSDYAQTVGADDTWFIKDLYFVIFLPGELTYIPTDSIINPANVSISPGGTVLEYYIPYTKPNEYIPDIYFDAILSPNLVGNGNPIVVESQVDGRNINDEYVDYLSSYSNITIYGNGINNMILSLTTDGNTKFDKDSEFSYYINAFNNTTESINNYMILNVLPYNNDERGSTFSGSYKVHLSTDSIGGASVLCTNADPKNISNDVLDTETLFTDCSDIFNNGVYKDITAIKIINISANAQSAITPIKVTVKPNGNKYSDVYKVSAVGGSATYMPSKSNELSLEVINRKITGKVYIDVEEHGIQMGNEKPLGNIPVSLYKIVNDTVELVEETTTLDSGVYTFENLDKGFYKIRLAYNDDLYDLTLRYAIEDTNRDSDAYKISDGLAEITNKHDASQHDGIDLVSNTEVYNMDMGLINRMPFGMTIKKYITKVDLNYNGITDTKLYNNESKVVLSVRNSLKASAKVYYGFEITNNSQVRGYVDNIYEDIPKDLIYDSTDPYNEGWVLVGDQLQNTSFKDTVIEPGESIYVQLALFMPNREEAGVFLNKVSLEIRPGEELTPPLDGGYDPSTSYQVGEAVNYAGLGWHVIKTSTSGGEEYVTLLLDSEYSTRNGYVGTDLYKWSNVGFELGGNLSAITSTLEDNEICDDASGLSEGSYGGSLKGGKCTSNQYVTSKVRLLTEAEYRAVLNRNLADVSWLYGRDYYLQTAVNVPNVYNEFGNLTENHSDEIRYINANTSSVGTVKVNATPSKYFRYVITVKAKNILNY